MLKKIMNPFAILLLAFTPLHGTILVRGNGTAPQTFTQPVASKVLDPATGTLYVGLAASGGNFALSKIVRTYSSPSPAPQAVAIGSNVTGANIYTLALATFQGNTTPLLVGARTISPALVFAQTNTGTQFVQSSTLLDASGTTDTNGQSTSGVQIVSANNFFIFAAVAPNQNVFGQINSGVAVVRINRTTFGNLPVLTNLTQTAAVAGDMGIKAKKIDPTIPEVQTATTTNEPTITPNVDLFWDEPLQRLYTSLALTTGAAANDGAKSIVVGRSENGELNIVPFVEDGALVAGETDRMIAVIGASQSLFANFVRVMHNSTGTSYLIVNGGNGDATTTGNRIFALPLVDDPSLPLVHGTLADKNAPLADKDRNLGTKKFVTPATTNAGLPSDTESPFMVGNGPFPFNPPHIISDIVVIGDTVYASSNVPQSTTDETGVFYSQAMFDNEGKIIRWTPWAKRAFPIDGIPGPMMTGRIKFFDVDAVTGNVYGIDDDTGRTIALTQWDHGTSPEALATQLNLALAQGTYSVLDLDQATRGLGRDTASRYALFGGVAKIIFAQTSVSRASGVPFNKNAITQVPFPQTVIDDFSIPQNLITTTIPGNAGCVTSLEFSRRTAAEGSNYFFAGTKTGLFVFASRIGQSLPIASFGNLNQPPFSNGIWLQAPNISGSIIDIKSAGQMLYVLTSQPAACQPFKSVLYRIPFQNTVAAMFAPSNIIPIATTTTNPIFGNTLLFTGIQIIKTGATSGGGEDLKEQLALATNTGLYVSSANQLGIAQGIIDAIDQTAANWTLIDGTTMFSGVAGMDTPLPATVWPLSIQDATKFRTDGSSTVQQLNGNGNALGTAALFGLVPTRFNASSTTQPFNTLAPISYFTSDGQRRFFISGFNSNNPSLKTITIFPWDVQNWNISNPSQGVLFGQGLSGISSFTWLAQLGATGIFMAGTLQGVVALE